MSRVHLRCMSHRVFSSNSQLRRQKLHAMCPRRISVTAFERKDHDDKTFRIENPHKIRIVTGSMKKGPLPWGENFP